MDKKIIPLFYFIGLIIALVSLYFIFGKTEKKETESKIIENNAKIDSIRNENKFLETKIKDFQTKNDSLKTKEKIIYQKIYIGNEKIKDIQSLPNALPDSTLYKFFAEFKADTTSKR